MDLDYTQQGCERRLVALEISDRLLLAADILFSNIGLAAAFVAIITDAAKAVWQF